MEILLLALLVALLLPAAAWVHGSLPLLAPHPAQLWTARLILVAVGIAFGWTMVQVGRQFGSADDLLIDALVFATAFGVVHLPAFFIALIKRERRRQGAGPPDRPPTPWDD